jgi:hypothetical protein
MIGEILALLDFFLRLCAPIGAWKLAQKWRSPPSETVHEQTDDAGPEDGVD